MSLAVLVVTALVVVSILGLARNWDASAHGEPTPTDAEQETRNQMGKEFVIISLLVAGSAVGALVFSSIRGRPGRGTR